MPDIPYDDIHVDEFFADAGKILVNLFRVFPRPVTLFAEDICGADTPDEYGVHSQRFQACFAAMLWLGEEGYLRYQDTIKSDAIDQAVLTGKCFTALLAQSGTNAGAEVNAGTLQARESSLIYQLSQALNSKSSTSIARAFIPLLNSMAGQR
ncbi:MAG: hypothetical protein AAF993_05775 [Pseudomonadota bacterium]